MSVLVFEEHSAVLAEWRSQGSTTRTVVYLDAHLDLQYVSEHRLARLDQATPATIRSLEKPHHLMPDENYSYSIHDFLYPAHRLGMMERLIWVAPPHVNIGYSELALRQIQQMDGVRHEDLLTFKKADGGWLSGRLFGLDVTLCSYSQLPEMHLPENSRIDIDIDYFVHLPGDYVWIHPQVVFATLARLFPRPELVTISRSIESGFTPLRYRFIADWFAALWESRESDCAHFQRLYQLDEHLRLRTGSREKVVDGCRAELRGFSDCAATLRLMGLAESNQNRAAQFLNDAAQKCASYKPSVLRLACEILGRQLPRELSKIKNLVSRISQTHPDERDAALAHVALGICYCNAGHTHEALENYDCGAKVLGAHPELALEIGKTLFQKNQFDTCESLLNVALKDDKTRSTANVFLAQLYSVKGMPDLAVKHLEETIRMAPAWLQLLPMLAELQKRLGNHQKSRQSMDTFARQQKQIESLIKRL